VIQSSTVLQIQFHFSHKDSTGFVAKKDLEIWNICLSVQQTKICPIARGREFPLVHIQIGQLTNKKVNNAPLLGVNDPEAQNTTEAWAVQEIGVAHNGGRE